MATMTMEATVVTGTMKAVVQNGMGSAEVLSLGRAAIPALTDDRVLVKVHASSINAADYHALHGGLIVTIMGKLLVRGAKSQTPPPAPGSDVSGVVVEAGKNVTAFRPGDEVFGTARGSWAEYATGSERSLVKKPAALSFAEAGAIGIAATTALQGLRDKGNVKPGQRVLVFGAGGGVGTFAVQIAKALGTHVTAVTGPRTIDLVRPLGADVLLDYTRDDITKRAERFDVIYDVAATMPLGRMLRVLAPGGVYVLAGAAKRGGMLGIMRRLIAAKFRERLLKQPIVFYVASIRRDDLAYLAELAEAGKVRPVVERTYPLSEIREAVRYTERGTARAKVVLTVP